jgi:diguanylate cyclase (GGDEF)-like protein
VNVFDDRRVRKREIQEKHFWAIRLRGTTLLGVGFVYLYLAVSGRVPINPLAVALMIGFLGFNRARSQKVSTSFSRWMIAIDVCLITTAVWATGGVASFLIPLYFLQVVATSLYTNTRQGVLTALNAWTIFTGVALLEGNGIIPHGPLAASPLAAKLASDAGFVEAQVLGFFVLLGAVTYCSAYIAQRLRVREKELGKAHDELEILYRASDRFLKAQTVERLAEELCRATVRLGAEAVGAFLEGEDGVILLGSYPQEMPEDIAQAINGRAQDYFSSNPGDTIQARLGEDSEFGLVRFRTGDGVRGVVVLQVAIQDLVGASPEGVGLLVQQFAPALTNLRAYEVQTMLATTDPLTGASNRREFDRFLAEEIARARRYLRPLSLVMVDIDHFKRLNDTRGHQDGDLVLQKVVGAMKSVVRNQDMLARYGGEEFAIIAPETGPKQAMVLAERLRAAIQEETYWSQKEEGPPVTASLGVACRLPMAGEPGFEGLVQRADTALYAAKEGGRNQAQAFAVEMLAPEDSSPPQQHGCA